MIENAWATGCHEQCIGAQGLLVLVMYRRETISTLGCIPIRVHLHSYNSKAPLGFRVVSCSVYSNQIASESSRPAWVREHMGLRLASSCVNVTPHRWAWPAATACLPHKMMRRIIISAQGTFIYVCYSITSSSPCLQPLYTYHASMRTLIIDCPWYWTMLHCLLTARLVKGLWSCGLWSWFHICPSGQILRSRPFGNHANIPHQQSMLLQL